MSIQLRVEGASKDLRIMYPEPEEIQLNFCTLIDLEFTSFTNKEEEIVQFQLNEVVALKIQTQEVILQLDPIKKRFMLQCLVYPGENMVWVSCMNNYVVTEKSLDYVLMGKKPQLETITEEDDIGSPIKRRSGKENKPIGQKQIYSKNISPLKTKSPKKKDQTTKRTKKSTLRQSQSMVQTPKSPLKGDYVDALLAQLIQQNSRKSKSRKRRPSTSYPLRPKIDSEGMIDRQWLEEEMINEDL
ncbi:unnamed protein product [Paramecium pentaurelia]|uniref:Uncharacterized protein n=1 Tax=Paramecium pentaurelia TaxID=43138 RepID=A0A8S1TWJ6_9CILI|nr:unnamed protein product [Paramecium pentaurelia]